MKYAFSTALVLLIVVMVINVFAKLAARKFRKV
jgi:ABC-type phosphate transport system permease subunit